MKKPLMPSPGLRPHRGLLKAYSQSAATVNILSAITTGGYAGTQKVAQCNIDFTNHSEQGNWKILLYGENIKNLKLEWLRSQIDSVRQEPALLILRIRDNIAYGRPNATMDQIEEAAKIAHAHTFSSSLVR